MSRCGRWLGALVVALLLCLGASDALAQRRTGGSFGGGSFHGGSSRGSSSHHYGSSRSSSSGTRSRRSSVRPSTRSPSGFGSGPTTHARPPRYSSSASSHGRGGSWSPSWHTILLMAIVVGGAAALVFSKYLRGPGVAPAASDAEGDAESMHICQLRLGVDWRARRDLQAKLRWLADRGDTSTPEGLLALLRETTGALRGAELSWLYAAQRSLGPMGADDAQRSFDRLTMAARAAYSHELVRASDGQRYAAEGPAQAPRPDQGEGVVVITLIVGATRAVEPLGGPTADRIAALLDRLGGLYAGELVALEVVWSPADEDDRMSTAELELAYPDLALIDPESVAGRVFCGFCRGPFAMELGTCPHCGAPADASSRAPRRHS